MSEQFDVKAYLIKVQGGRQYLPVPARVMWMRSERSGWAIETHIVSLDIQAGVAVCSATVKNEDGKVLGQGTKLCTQHQFGDFLEKAETGAVGRALALCGYGTQFAPDIDDGNNGGSQGNRGDYRNDRQDNRQQPCERQACSNPECQVPLSPGQVTFSMREYKSPLCPKCQDRVKHGELVVK